MMHFIKINQAKFPSSFFTQIRNRICVIIFLMFVGINYSVAETFWIKTSGSDSTGVGTETLPWATLKHACENVPANEGHTIRLGEGVFMDVDRFDNSIIAPIIPENVSLIGAGMNKTTYIGGINVNKARSQIISDFTIDGTENTDSLKRYYQGLAIVIGDSLEIKNIRIQGFYGMGMELGRNSGLKNSSLHHCELINNGTPNRRGFGMRSGNLTDCKIHDNIFIEERGKGGEPWNTGDKIFTNVKVYNNKFTTHNDIAAGWSGQVIFNFEWWRVDCLNVEIYNNEFDGSLSLIDRDNRRENRTPFSIRVYNNRWTYTKRYGIEAGMSDFVVDHNYFHFGTNSDPDIGNGYMAVGQFSPYKHNNVKIHHNVIVDVPMYAFFNLIGDDTHIYNNTVIGSRSRVTPDFLKNVTPRFIVLDKGVQLEDYNIKNNVFLCDEGRMGKFMSFDETLPTNLNISSNIIFQSITGMSETMLALDGVEAPMVADPKFVTSGDRPDPYYKPASGSPCIDAGEVIPGITDGYEGTAPDIGASSGGFLSSASISKLNDDIQIYPNPTKNFLYISFNNTENIEYTLNIYDITGKVQKQVNGFKQHSNELISVDCSALNSGIYLVEFKSNKSRKVKKIVKK